MQVIRLSVAGFLLQLALYIKMQPQKFPSEHTKVAFLNTLLSGRALTWARAIWNANTAIINSYEAFTNHFSEVFGLATGALSVSDQLLRLHQGTSHLFLISFLISLPLPTSTRCSSVLWRQLAVGAKQLSPALSGRDWIPVSALRWRYMMRIGNLHAKGQTDLPATPPKLFTSPSQPPMVSQCQNPYK